MRQGSLKTILVAVFSVFSLLFVNNSFAQEKAESHVANEKTEKKSFDANEVIFGHVLDAHEFHFLSYKDKEGDEHHANIPLPVILYSPQKGFDVFMSSNFHHGEHTYKGYDLLTDEKIAKVQQLNALATEREQNLAQMALAWVLKDKRITSVILGVSKPEQVLDSIRCLENYAFTNEEEHRINQILA